MNAPIPEDLQVWYGVACDGISFKTDHKVVKVLIERIAASEQKLAECASESAKAMLAVKFECDQRITSLKQECDDLRKEIVHLSHCNFGENKGSCKYGEDDCPALSESWSWFGKALQEREQEQKLREEWRAATLAEQSKVTQLVAEKAMLISERDQLRAKLALLTDPAAVHNRRSLYSPSKPKTPEERVSIQCAGGRCDIYLDHEWRCTFGQEEPSEREEHARIYRLGLIAELKEQAK